MSDERFPTRVRQAGNLVGNMGFDDKTAIKMMVENGEKPEEAFMAVKAARVVAQDKKK